MASVNNTLGLVQGGDRFFVPFFGTGYLISPNGIEDAEGKKT